MTPRLQRPGKPIPQFNRRIPLVGRVSQHHLLCPSPDPVHRRRSAPEKCAPVGCRPGPSELPASHTATEWRQPNGTVSWTETDDRSSQTTACASEVVARGGVEPPTFRFSGLRMRVRQAPPASVTCIAALIRTLLNSDERRRMRPEMSPQGLLLRCGSPCGARRRPCHRHLLESCVWGPDREPVERGWCPRPGGVRARLVHRGCGGDPRDGFSRARRTTRSRISSLIGGRPDRFG